MKSSITKILAITLVCLNFGLLGITARGAIGDAKVIPGEFNNLEYFYVFGPGARRTDGREDGLQILFYRFPKSVQGNIDIYVFDPGVGGIMDSSDQLTMSNSVTRFTVYGGSGAFTDFASQSIVPTHDQPGTVLTSEEYSDEYSDQWVKLGSFSSSQGETVGDYVYFKLSVFGYSGSLGNSFRTAVTPTSAEVFSYNTTVRLNEIHGSTMSFEVEVPENVSTIIEENYDMDRGGKPFLLSPLKRHKLQVSGTGQWRKNKVRIGPSSFSRLLRYEIVKGSQTYANSGFRFTDAVGNPLKVYFDAEARLPTPAVVIDTIPISDLETEAIELIAKPALEIPAVSYETFDEPESEAAPAPDVESGPSDRDQDFLYWDAEDFAGARGVSREISGSDIIDTYWDQNIILIVRSVEATDEQTFISFDIQVHCNDVVIRPRFIRRDLPTIFLTDMFRNPYNIGIKKIDEAKGRWRTPIRYGRKHYYKIFTLIEDGILVYPEAAWVKLRFEKGVVGNEHQFILRVPYPYKKTE